MLTQISYNRANAIEYARRWALSRNPLFTDFTGRGGNCTNFVSQCILAGGGVMDFTPTFGWYYRDVEDRAPAWSGVEPFFDFVTRSSDFADMVLEGPFATVATDRRSLEVGDVIQLADSEDDFYHTLIISEFTPNDILVCAQSDNALDRPLSSYNYSSLRVLHIMGIALDIPTETVYTDLLGGTALRSVTAEAREVSDANFDL